MYIDVLIPLCMLYTAGGGAHAHAQAGGRDSGAQGVGGGGGGGGGLRELKSALTPLLGVKEAWIKGKAALSKREAAGAG
jgi:hypothetical protein